MLEIKGEVIVRTPVRSNSGCFVRLELPGPKELEPFFQGSGKRFAFVMLEIPDAAGGEERNAERQKDVQESAAKKDREGAGPGPLSSGVVPRTPSVLFFQLCKDKSFQQRIQVGSEAEAAELVKNFFSVGSRKELDRLSPAAIAKFFAHYPSPEGQGSD